MAWSLRDRQGRECTARDIEALVAAGALHVAENRVERADGGPDIIVRSEWMPLNRDGGDALFETRVLGGRGSGIIRYSAATEEEVLAIHRGVVGRLREQERLRRTGGAAALDEGVL
ncbi:hypothetical protein ACFQ36_07060 [Arthrobacter sp. GCM10027362]|uniref:hypothetical protein n=1 Tax=Arthrobacter sp. GCM10027362 TaxID=3273379 RepID=UPI00362E2B03